MEKVESYANEERFFPAAANQIVWCRCLVQSVMLFPHATPRPLKAMKAYRVAVMGLHRNSIWALELCRLFTCTKSLTTETREKHNRSSLKHKHCSLFKNCVCLFKTLFHCTSHLSHHTIHFSLSIIVSLIGNTTCQIAYTITSTLDDIAGYDTC